MIFVLHCTCLFFLAFGPSCHISFLISPFNIQLLKIDSILGHCAEGWKWRNYSFPWRLYNAVVETEAKPIYTIMIWVLRLNTNRYNGKYLKFSRMTIPKPLLLKCWYFFLSVILSLLYLFHLIEESFPLPFLCLLNLQILDLIPMQVDYFCFP